MKRSKSCDITINLFEPCGMIVTAFVAQILLVDRPTSEGESVMMRGDIMSAVSWVNRCGGSHDRRAGILMIMSGGMEIKKRMVSSCETYRRGGESVGRRYFDMARRKYTEYC